MTAEHARWRGIAGAAFLAAQLALVASCAPPDSSAAAQPPAETVEVRTVRSPNPAGVPLHPTATSNEVSGRLPNGTAVRVLAFTADRRRLEVEGAGARGFIVRRYLVSGEHVRDEAPAARSPFDSADACARSDRPARAARPIRIASWNVRWFPDGSADRVRGEGTDVAWLACAIASLDADVLAVQEFVRHDRGREALDELLRSLGHRTGARWRAVFDGCPADGRQHVGFLYREDRIRLEGVRDLAGVNGGRSACEHRLRPGLFARAVGPAGFEADLVNVHLDSGVEGHDRAHRANAADAIVGLVAGRSADDGSRPLVVLGDFNTMGCEECRPRETAAAELEGLVGILGAAGLVRAEPSAGCTHRSGRRSAVLDHVFVLARGGALDRARARILGPCADSCAATRRHAPFFDRLSDHCPIAVDLGSPARP